MAGAAAQAAECSDRPGWEARNGDTDYRPECWEGTVRIELTTRPLVSRVTMFVPSLRVFETIRPALS